MRGNPILMPHAGGLTSIEASSPLVSCTDVTRQIAKYLSGHPSEYTAHGNRKRIVIGSLYFREKK